MNVGVVFTVSCQAKTQNWRMANNAILSFPVLLSVFPFLFAVLFGCTIVVGNIVFHELSEQNVYIKENWIEIWNMEEWTGMKLILTQVDRWQVGWTKSNFTGSRNFPYWNG